MKLKKSYFGVIISIIVFLMITIVPAIKPDRVRFLVESIVSVLFICSVFLYNRLYKKTDHTESFSPVKSLSINQIILIVSLCFFPFTALFSSRFQGFAVALSLTGFVVSALIAFFRKNDRWKHIASSKKSPKKKLSEKALRYKYTAIAFLNCFLLSPFVVFLLQKFSNGEFFNGVRVSDAIFFLIYIGWILSPIASAVFLYLYKNNS